MKHETSYSVNRLAEMSGFDRRTVKKVLAGVTTTAGRQVFTLAEFCAGLKHHFDAAVQNQRERRARLQSDLLQHRLDCERKKFVPLDELTFCWQDMSAKMRADFAHFARKCVYHHRVFEKLPAEAERLIDDELREVLDVFTDPENHRWFGPDEPPPENVKAFHEYVRGFPPKPGAVHEALLPPETTADTAALSAPQE